MRDLFVVNEVGKEGWKHLVKGTSGLVGIVYSYSHFGKGVN